MAYLPENYSESSPYSMEAMRREMNAVEDNISTEPPIGLGILHCAPNLPSTRLPYTIAPASLSLSAPVWSDPELVMNTFPSSDPSPNAYTPVASFHSFDDSQALQQSFINSSALSLDEFLSAINYTQSFQSEKENLPNAYTTPSPHQPPQTTSPRKSEKSVNSESRQRRWRIARSSTRKSLDIISRNDAGRRSQPPVSPISNGEVNSFISICSGDHSAAESTPSQSHSSTDRGRCNPPSTENSPLTLGHGEDAEYNLPPQLKYKCTICGYMFTRRSNCRDHVKRHDPRLRRSFGCHVCGRVFSRRTDLNRHIQSVS
jgi:hypothetical protein